jgi:hypothetical protein
MGAEKVKKPKTSKESNEALKKPKSRNKDVKGVE